ncbi:MAG: arylsulfotransferase family protein [Bacteroidia bacterium]
MAHHHSLNLDAEQNFWACSYSKEENGNFITYKGFYRVDGQKFQFIDNTFTQIDSETGEILYHKSLSEIIAENDLGYLLVQSANIGDPIHLNDVQPALKTTDFYQKGDVFLSMRNLSAIFHYRPSNDSLIEVIQGPFSTQHDVDFYNDSTICFFNNNGHTIWSYPPSAWSAAKEQIGTGEFSSNITFYNLNSKTFSAPYNSVFQQNQIFTFTEGGQEFLPNGDVFVEEQNSGFFYILNQKGVVYQNVFKSQHQGYHHLTNWIRIIQ